MASSACRAIAGATSQAGCKTTSDSYGFQSQSFSAGIWVRATSFPNGRNGLMGTDNGSNGWALSITSGSKPRFSVAGVGNSDMTNSVSTATWYFIAVTKVSASTNIMYVITTAGAVTSETVTARTVNANTGDFYLGAVGSTASTSTNGNICHAQVWNRVLTQNELLNAAFAPGSVTNGLLSYWPLYGQTSPEIDLGNLNTQLTVNTGATATSTNSPFVQVPYQGPMMMG